MKISTLSGHLTITNQNHIKAMFKAGLNQAKVNRINYDITPENGFYKVRIAQRNTSYISGIETSKATFKTN